MKINILNKNDNEELIMRANKEMLEAYPWIVLNIDEIGHSIGDNLTEAEYQITQEILDEEINDYLSGIHERIIEKAIQTLADKNIEVL